MDSYDRISRQTRSQSFYTGRKFQPSRAVRMLQASHQSWLCCTHVHLQFDAFCHIQNVWNFRMVQLKIKRRLNAHSVERAKLGATSQQRTLSPPDTWSCPIWDLHLCCNNFFWTCLFCLSMIRWNAEHFVGTGHREQRYYSTVFDATIQIKSF